MKNNVKKRQVREIKNDCSWFDTENARLIILCALFGFVGAHKFAMGKKGQGWCFILLDLTIVGILISAIWAFIDLLFLTIKKDNKPGNMIFGAFFLMCGMVLPLTFGCSCPNPTVVEVGKVSNKVQKTTDQQPQVVVQEINIEPEVVE